MKLHPEAFPKYAEGHSEIFCNWPMFDKDKKTGKKRILSFKYNALGKPVEIEMKNVGKINVAYDNYGEIKKVESKQGHKMALQVTQAFQSLLSIVKPAGVNLNM